MSQNEQMIKDAMKYAMSQLPGAEEILKIKAENESLQAQVVALQASEAKLEEEVMKLTGWLATAHENADAKIHNESAGLIIQENEKLKEEIDDLKYDMENDLYTEQQIEVLREEWIGCENKELRKEIIELKAKINQK